MINYEDGQLSLGKCSTDLINQILRAFSTFSVSPGEYSFNSALDSSLLAEVLRPTDHMPPAPEGKGNRCLPFTQNIPLPAIRFSEKHDEDLGELFHSAISPQPDTPHDLGFFSKIL
jgi:hypothetical protein